MQGFLVVQTRIHMQCQRKAAIVGSHPNKGKTWFMSSSHDSPPATLDCDLEVGPDDWQAPGFISF